MQLIYTAPTPLVKLLTTRWALGWIICGVVISLCYRFSGWDKKRREKTTERTLQAETS